MKCYFCDNKEVIVTTLVDKLGNELPVCHVCFNQATRSLDGLKHNGRLIEII